MTSSHRRVIKQLDSHEGQEIEQYLPPQEVVINSRRVVERAPTFPRYSSDGRKQGEYRSVIRFTAQDIQKEEKEEPQPEQEQESQEEPVLETPEDITEKTEEAAREALEEARRQAERILMDAAREARHQQEEARQAGLREGYEAGYQEGRQKAEAECRETLQSTLATFQEDMRQALKSVESAKERCLRNYLDELKDCAVAVAEKVIHISLRSSGEVIKQMIISATEKLKKTAWVKIYIDKCDYDIMMESDAAILDELSHLSDNIKFIVMDKEDRGNCIIEMPEEIVDVSVNTQIENIKDILENVRV